DFFSISITLTYKIEQITCKRFPSILQLLLLNKKQLYSYYWILEFSETSNEAQSLMGNGINFDKLEEQDFTKYLSYMTRHYALEQ
ncbi:hypothetical protein, partial [Enterococcus faecium]|uniref:hypothetical protein n=1 Tax=Enterococcus faecium TaxID=1352 RepID=UPI00292D28D5